MDLRWGGSFLNEASDLQAKKNKITLNVTRKQNSL